MKEMNMSKIKIGIVALSFVLSATSFASTSSDIKLASALVEKSQDAQAEKLLNKIIASSKGEDKNEAILIFGRMKFQEKKFNQAITVYKQVPSISKFWVEATEERAWAELNLTHFEKALSLYNTLTSQSLGDVVGPEAYLIGAIADLRICNYKEIFDDIKLFKERFRPRIQTLTKVPAPLYANQDLGNIQSVIKKMHIIEIEAIQRMGLKRNAGGDYSKMAVKSSDTITFPKESEEWLDESKFDVSAKHCMVISPKVSALKSGARQ